MLGGVFWRDLKTQYHLYGIRKDVREALAIITQPEGTPERRAMRRYIAESLEIHGKLPPADPARGRTDIVGGDVSARGLCRFLSDWTGLATIMDGDLWDASFTVPGGINAVDAELVGLLLAAHGCSLSLKTLPNERRVLRMRSTAPPRGSSTQAGMPRSPVVERGGDPMLFFRTMNFASTDISEGAIQVTDLAASIASRSGGPVSVDPDVRDKLVYVAAHIHDADAFVIQELISANGCFLERVDENGLRFRVKPQAKD